MEVGSTGPRAIVVMGVAGSGKTTVGRLLADALDWPFLDGDALHSPTAIARMRNGQPLDDTDRAPWLTAIGTELDRWRQQGRSGVIACSALKRRYRTELRKGRDLLFVHLHGSPALLEQRLHARSGHFMPAALLQSQLADLEPPAADEPALTVSIKQPPERIVQLLQAELVGS